MGDNTFPLACFDARALSCPLDEKWKCKMAEKERYKRTWDRLSAESSKWKYDETDCQCISAFGYGEHDERNECRCCGRCIADESGITETWACYDDKAFCIQCAMALEEWGIEEIAGLFN